MGGVVTAGTSEEEIMRDSGAVHQREVADQPARTVCIVLAGP